MEHGCEEEFHGLTLDRTDSSAANEVSDELIVMLQGTVLPLSHQATNQPTYLMQIEHSYRQPLHHSCALVYAVVEVESALVDRFLHQLIFRNAQTVLVRIPTTPPDLEVAATDGSMQR